MCVYHVMYVSAIVIHHIQVGSKKSGVFTTEKSKNLSECCLKGATDRLPSVAAPFRFFFSCPYPPSCQPNEKSCGYHTNDLILQIIEKIRYTSKVV